MDFWSEIAKQFKAKSKEQKKKVGLLIDGPNMIRKEFNINLDEVRRKAQKYGDVKIAKTFLNQYAKDKLIEAVANQGFEPVMSISEDIDLDMAVDAMELIHNPMIDTIILVTRDSDYLPVVRKAKEYNKEAIIFGVNVGFSLALQNAADAVEFLTTNKDVDR